MTNKEAIEIIKMERDHCATHNRDAGMSEEYHKEMQNLVDAFNLAIKTLEGQPQGEWIATQVIGISDITLTCSNCKDSFIGENDIDTWKSVYHYCPSCGAKMKGGVK